MPTWWIRRITLSPPSAYEGAPHETFRGTTKMPAGGARTRAAGGVTLERDHWITLPEPLCLGNVLRDWLAAGRTEEPLELLPRHRRRRADLRVLLDMAADFMPTSAVPMPGVERTNWSARWASLVSPGMSSVISGGR